jgi:hypothetical protein
MVLVKQHQEWAATSRSVRGGGVTGHSLARMRERAVDLMPSPKAANRCSARISRRHRAHQ